jgi:hypothetical protein
LGIVPVVLPSICWIVEGFEIVVVSRVTCSETLGIVAGLRSKVEVAVAREGGILAKDVRTTRRGKGFETEGSGRAAWYSRNP